MSSCFPAWPHGYLPLAWCCPPRESAELSRQYSLTAINRSCTRVDPELSLPPGPSGPPAWIPFPPGGLPGSGVVAEPFPVGGLRWTHRIRSRARAWSGLSEPTALPLTSQTTWSSSPSWYSDPCFRRSEYHDRTIRHVIRDRVTGSQEAPATPRPHVAGLPRGRLAASAGLGVRKPCEGRRQSEIFMFRRSLRQPSHAAGSTGQASAGPVWRAVTLAVRCLFRRLAMLEPIPVRLRPDAGRRSRPVRAVQQRREGSATSPA